MFSAIHPPFAYDDDYSEIEIYLETQQLVKDAEQEIAAIKKLALASGFIYVIDGIDVLDEIAVLSTQMPTNINLRRKLLHAIKVIKTLREQNLPSYFRKSLNRFEYAIRRLKKITAKSIQLRFKARDIVNRVSKSRNPFKTEPPIGGVKTGGEQHGMKSHVVKILYQENTSKLAA